MDIVFSHSVNADTHDWTHQGDVDSSKVGENGTSQIKSLS